MKRFTHIFFSLITALFIGQSIGYASAAPVLGHIITGMSFVASQLPLEMTGSLFAGMFTPAQMPYTYDHVTEFGEIIFEKAYSNPELDALHKIETGIKAKKQIGISGRMGLIGKAKAGCAFTADNQVITFTPKYWDPKPVDAPFSQCIDDLLPSFWAWGLKNGKDRDNLTGTDFEVWFSDLYAEASLAAALRIAWMGATDHANYSDSPPGFVSNGTSTDYYTILDGLFYQIFDICATDVDRRYTIAENANSTYALQTLAADKGQTILKNLREGSDDRLRDDEDGVILVTRSIMDNYAETLRSKAVPESFGRIEGGYRTASYDGVPVIEVPIWDRLIKNDFNNGTKYWLPHRAVYTNLENLAIGLEESDSYTGFNAWHNPDEGEWRARGQFTIDSKVVVDSQIQAAY
tara:strand:- start:2117 stop:3334 length:1218 start_codon:yes stop_codon:yes gene_type:complete